MSNIEKLIKNSQNPKLIRDVFEFAKMAYKGKNRLSGENYIEHALRVASSLQDMGLDETTISAALLHDVIDDTPAAAKKKELAEIEKKFGGQTADLVEKVSKLGRIQYSLAFNLREKKALTKEKIESLRKMFIALAGDLRAILIELASRLDGLDYLNLLPAEQQKLHAIETLEIFSPVANRLGLGNIRRRLEDLSFSYLFPERYKWLHSQVKEHYEKRQKHLKKFIAKLKRMLMEEGVEFLTADSRAKSYWSTYQKLVRHNMDFGQIHDLMAVRIIVKNVEDCYKTLGIMHKHYKPISQEINDYIAKPKPNGYRSLHTTVFYAENEISEIQIRTEEMHKEAEYGVCAHWSYKEKINLKKSGADFEWLSGAEDFWKTFKIDFFPSQVFALTPKGDVIMMRKGSTPVDFAYAIHSQVGSHCESAKVGGKLVPLSYVLENGDIVEIITNKNKKPSLDWLKFVKTSLAHSLIKKAVSEGQPAFKFPLPGFIKRKLAEISEKAQKKRAEQKQIQKSKIPQIYLAGQKGMLVHIAKCCNPQAGDRVHAYITKHRAAVLHKNTCPNFRRLAEKFPDKIINAHWQ